MIRLQNLETLDAARGRIAALGAGLAEFTALHRKTGRHLLEWTLRNLDAGGALHGDFPSGWPPLAATTLAARRRAGTGELPLQATGALRAGISLTADAGQAVLGNPVPYAARHQQGLGVPRRPFFPGGAQARALVMPVARGHVAEVLQ